MIQTTTWTPDTCAGCVIEYQWDDSVDASVRTHTPSRTLAQCVFHAGLDVTGHYAKLLDENPRKNKLIGQAIANVSALLLSDITWAFDANRVLQVSIPKITTAQKNTLQTWANTNLGIGKVLIS